MTLRGILTGLGVLLCSTLGVSQDVVQKHNIVFILTDDQDARMGSLDHMPKVQDLLIKHGTHYTRHYAPTALCCPARVSIWTGLHAHNHKVTDVGGPFGGWPQIIKQKLNSNYLPIWLRDNGYKTYYAGKLYNGMNKENGIEKTTARGWTKADLLCGAGTYQYFDPSFQHIAGNWDNPEKINTSFKGEYSTDKVANYGYGYLHEALKQNDPFFVAIAPITPHSQVGHDASPPKPAKKYEGTMPHAKVPKADNFNPPNRSGVNTVWKLEQLSPQNETKLHKNYQARTEALLSVDDMVEHVVNILDQANQLDKTFIIYSSDNGFHLGHHRLGPGKKFSFEEDINVPLIIRGPGVPKNKKTDVVTTHVDLAPTILDMAGMKPRDGFDGRKIPYSAADIQQREDSGQDEHANVEFWTGTTFKFNGKKGERVNSYKSLRLAGKGYDISYTVHCEANAHELYDMAADVVQMHNLHPSAPAPAGGKNAFDAGQTQLAGYPIKKLLPRLDALLLVLKSCTGNACAQPWHELHQGGQVKNVKDAMDTTWDRKYEELYAKYKVRFNRCFKNGTIDIEAEGPQWKGDGRVDAGPPVLMVGNGTEVDESWEQSHDVDEGWWDDWE